MEKLKELLSGTSRDQLIEKLFHSSYAFAIWQMPESEERQFIISLTRPEQSEISLDTPEKGFMVNEFNHSHPIKPLFIKADIIVNEKLSVDPRVNSEQLDQFVNVISSGESEKSERESLSDNHYDNEFESLIQKSILEIEKGTFEKVVLSRSREVTLSEEFSVTDFFKKLCDNYTHSFCSMVHLPGEGIWIGASPELLISNNESRFRTVALAGTKKLEENQLLSEIAWTQKEIEEQAFVSRYVINCFKKIRLREFHEHGPKTVQAGALAHLKTVFEVRYDEIQFENLADQMLQLLHPTSAVCGMPLDTSRAFIEENEGYDRSFYSGFLGPVNFDGSTDLFVNLRCMNISGNTGSLYAGAGITADSIPEKEMKETELKMETLLRFIDQK